MNWLQVIATVLGIVRDIGVIAGAAYGLVHAPRLVGILQSKGKFESFVNAMSSDDPAVISEWREKAGSDLDGLLLRGVVARVLEGKRSLEGGPPRT